MSDKSTDLNENVNGQKEENEEVSLTEGLTAAKDGLNLYFQNKFVESKKLLSSKADHSLFHAIGLSYYLITYAVFTVEKPLIEEASQKISAGIKLCEKKRKVNSITQSVANLFKKTNYNEYTDEEAHAEICYAEMNFMMVFCNFVSEQSLMSIIRGVRNLMITHNAVKLSHEIMKGKTNWESDFIRRNYECAVHNGWGYYNLVLSHLPARVMKLGAIMGVPSSREDGLRSLHIAADDMTDMVRSKISSFLACFYSFYWEQFFGVGEADIDWCKRLTARGLQEFPEGAFDLYWAAKVHQLRGNNSEAIELMRRSYDSQSEFKQLHNVLDWDLCWLYAMNCDWAKAAECAKKLQENCQWSPATNCYQYACFMVMMMEDEGRPELREEVDKAMAEVPKLRHRIAGKTLPPEKFAIVMAQRYIDENAELLTPLMARIEKNLEQCPSGDYHYVLLLLRGVCLRYAKRPEEALDCFVEILRGKDNLDKDTYVLPQAAFELGMTYKDLGNFEDAKIWLEKARNEYTGFLIETLVHFRIHGALSKIKAATKQK